RSGFAATQDADDAVPADACLHLDSELAQMFGDERRGARLLEGKLRMLMDVASPRDDLGCQLGRATFDLLTDSSRRLRAQRCGDEKKDESAHGRKRYVKCRSLATRDL